MFLISQRKKYAATANATTADAAAADPTADAASDAATTHAADLAYPCRHLRPYRIRAKH